MPDFNTQSIATAEKHKLADTQTIALLILKKKTPGSIVYFYMTLLIFVC
jgi:hypothetical protein